ncbi:Rap30/74 interaction domain-containing protein [Xylariaceae sp. FL0016]|nr:Rap30/74 interaction domain-containing protein [Xylariaceae sp. FL0016]
MSASPSGGPNGQRPTPPPGAPPLRRRQAPSNPLVARKRPVKRPLPTKVPPTNKPSVAHPASKNQLKEPNFDHLRKKNGGWSQPAPEGATEFPLYVTKKDLKEGLRFHIMRLAPTGRGHHNTNVDPSDQDTFARPVTLHRRDPRQPPPGREVKVEVQEEQPVNDEEAQKQAQLKAEREAQRAIDDAQKAPVQKSNVKPKEKQKDQKKVPGIQPHHAPRTEEQKKENAIRYEETLPWHLEDADGKNVWVGQYEKNMSEIKVALIVSDGGFRMVPMERWYKFTPNRSAFQSMSIEEAEKVMSKKVAPSRWAIRETKRNEAERAMDEARRIVNGRVNVKQESDTFKRAARTEKADHDDLDLSGDEFQDDDETAGFEPDRDDEAKDSKDRVRREQLGANNFGAGDEIDLEKEEAQLKKEEEQRKMFGKNLKKALKKRDKQFQYDSESDENKDPFASSSDSDTDSDEENDEEKKAEKEKNAISGANTKGSNTPQGKKAAAEAAKKGKSLKRPGSPIPSDSSGTESTRKKKKTGPNTSSAAGSRGTTPLPSKRAGNTSDGEGTAGEMSDGAGGRIKKKKLLHLGGRGTPAGSRAGSPAPAPAGQPRATSPIAGSGASSPRAGNITVQEVIDAMPPLPNGITVGLLTKKFSDRIDKPGCISKKEWLALVKENATFSHQDKLLRRQTPEEAKRAREIREARKAKAAKGPV